MERHHRTGKSKNGWVFYIKLKSRKHCVNTSYSNWWPFTCSLTSRSSGASSRATVAIASNHTTMSSGRDRACQRMILISESELVSSKPFKHTLLDRAAHCPCVTTASKVKRPAHPMSNTSSSVSRTRPLAIEPLCVVSTPYTWTKSQISLLDFRPHVFIWRPLSK